MKERHSIISEEYTELMEYTVGQIVEGKVKSLTKFGAFVTLPGGTTGLVHISEVANTYVTEVSEFLHEGDEVRVMVIGTENGKISLSIKRTLPPAEKKPRAFAAQRPTPERTPRPAAAPAEPKQKSFDDMLRQFMSESDSKISSAKEYSDHKTKTRKR